MSLPLISLAPSGPTAQRRAVLARRIRLLFVNLEPSTLTQRLDVVLEALALRAAHVQVVVEITERALAADVAGVLAGAERLRAAGCAIALDDIGVQPESLAFIPLLRPEVVKLDLSLLRTVKDPTTVVVAGAVRAYAEQSGAEVVAEGIETEHDLTRALVLGATLGQGWLWGAVNGGSPRRLSDRSDSPPGRSGRRCTKHRTS
jgi:EAL domain-containing protein (putative c-di-GMP-specific phosphodiesterase class I)